MMEPSFANVLARLSDWKVEFILVGGLAVTLHGYVRFTEDVDILIEASTENVCRLLDCLAGFGEGYARELVPADFSDEEGAIRIVEESELCQLDVFTRMSGFRYRDILPDSEVFPVDGREIRYASKGSLIRWKEGSVREKDRIDAAALKEIDQCAG